MLAPCIAALLWLTTGAADVPAVYTITVPVQKDAVHVEATLPLTEPYLNIAEGWYSDGVKGGLAGFVEDLSITRADGTAVRVEGPTHGRWQVDAPVGEPVTVRYRVRLDHEKHKWPFGVDEIACVREDSVTFIARTLLLFVEGTRALRVRFNVPQGWRVATPWRPVDGQPFTFDAANLRHLTDSCVIAGDFVERPVQAGETLVTLAIGRALEPYADTLESAMRACVPAFAEVFRHSPQMRFLAVLNVNPAGGVTDGSAYANSVHMITPRRMEGANYDQAVYTMAHEVLHLWNGNRMRPAEQMEWFREGFTDYLTWRVLTNADLIQEQTVLVQLQRQVNTYLNLNRRVSLADAGENKSENANLIYEGGSLAALCLDATMRAQTAGEKTLVDFMRALYAQSALKNQPYDAAMIAATASEVAGTDLQPFFDRYVIGMEPLPLDDALAKLGLRAAQRSAVGRASVMLTPDESATGSAAKARDAFLGRD